MDDQSESKPEVESETAAPVASRPTGRRWQIGLRTIFLLVAAIAVWITFFVNRRYDAMLENRIAAMRPLARELVIDDPKQIAVVKLDEMWYDENQWHVYLPAGQYRLNLATRGIAEQGFVPAMKSGFLGGGRHFIALEQQPNHGDWRVVATSDRTGRLVIDEPKEWDPGSGSTGGGEFSLSAQVTTETPVVLFRRRFFDRPGPSGQLSSPGHPTEGVLLWIEKFDGSSQPPSKPR